MKPSLFTGICVSAAFAACAVAPDDAESHHAEALKGATATVAITSEPGGSCALACFDVQSSKDIGFIAVDATPCSEAPVELSLYAIIESGATIPVAITPAPHGNGKSCPDIAPSALKFDELSGRHSIVCAAGAQHADVFVKSGKTCAAQSFEIDVQEQCKSDTPGWLRDMGPGNGGDVAVDPSGNVLYTGPGGLTKLDGAGEVRWNFPHGERVASDAAGNVFVAGTFDTPLDLGFGPMLPEGSGDVFVAKLDRLGHSIWATAFGTAASESVQSMAVDAAGNIAVAISGMGTLKLAPDGQQLWSKAFSGAVAFDTAGNLAITGGFVDAIDVGSGLVDSTGLSDAFVVKLDPDGHHLWSHFLGDVTSGSQVGTSVAFDQQGNVLVVGEVSTSIALFGTDYILPWSDAASSSKGAYIAKLDPDGNPLWAKVRTFTRDMLDVAADSAGNVYLTGGDVGNVNPYRYTLLSMYDPSGVLQWSVVDWNRLGRGTALALDACDNLFWSLWWSEIVPDSFRTNHSLLIKLDG